MPVITSIKPQKNKKRVNIYFDGKFGFGVDLDNFVMLGLKVEQELTEREVEKIVKKAEFQKVYDKILRFVSLRPRSEKELRGWLKKYKVHESMHKELFNRLKRLDFLDDKKFAVWWVDQRIQFRQKGSKVLRLELRNKGISKEIVEEVFDDAQIDEVELAKILIKKKERIWRGMEGFERRVKISQFLARNGYSWETIKKVVGEFDQDI